MTLRVLETKVDPAVLDELDSARQWAEQRKAVAAFVLIVDEQGTARLFVHGSDRPDASRQYLTGCVFRALGEI